LAQNERIELEVFSISDKLTVVQSVEQWLNSKPLFFGYNTSLNQIKQWQQGKPADAAYHAVLLLTDKGNYESDEKIALDSDNQTPLWIVHLGGEPAYAYADQLLDHIYQSAGGVGHDLERVLRKISYKQQRSAEQLTRITDNYQWSFRKTKARDELANESEGLASIIAHQWISSDFNRFDANQTQVLDELHLMAKKHSLVSAFSSMIVLVNLRQQEQLEKLSKDDDRYQREVETGDKPLPKNSDMFSAVPEPEEWALIIIVLLVLSLNQLKKGKIGLPSGHRWRCS
jgi:putative PEP-CTERM system integral membrane protein